MESKAGLAASGQRFPDVGPPAAVRALRTGGLSTSTLTAGIGAGPRRGILQTM